MLIPDGIFYIHSWRRDQHAVTQIKKNSTDPKFFKLTEISRAGWVTANKPLWPE